MSRPETRVLSEEWDTNRRLAELGLSRDGLLRARDIAMNGRDNTGPYHCANSPGTYSHHEGVAGIREQFVGAVWELCRSDGIEGIRHAENRMKVGFQNVDIAHNLLHDPRPRSEKGSGAERAAEGNLFGDLPRHYKADAVSAGTPLYYLMVAPDGACELSLPIIRNGKFDGFVERIFLDDGKDNDGEKLPLTDDSDTVSSFDVPISKKG